MTLAPKVLIVGCGMTGSSVFHYLTRVFNLPSECFTIWEKTSDIGGRMKSTSYLGSHCDLGAQYITQSNAKYNDIYSHLISSNVFTKLAIDIDGMKPDAKLKNHYVSNQGLSAVIKQLSTNANIHTDISLDSFQTLPSGQVEVSGVSSLPHKAVVKDAYDIVVITSPSPTLTHLRSSLETIDQPGAHDLFEKFSAVGYSSRYALAVFYDPSVSTKLANLPWGAKFIFDNDVIRYVSVESRKHSGSVCDTLQTPLSILVHTSVPFGAEYANRSVEEVEDIILHNLALTVPELAGVAPQYRELKFYKQSQVFKKLTWREGESSAFFPTTPTKSKGVVFAGDYFTESNFEGCLASAHSASVAINQALASS